MFDKFTEKALKAIEVAKKLAEELGDESVATGHLIYGLVSDEAVCVHHLFKDLSVDPDMFSLYVKSLPREPEVAGESAPFNRHVMTAFARSSETAAELGSDVVLPEHMTIALLSVKAGSAYETLKEFSIEPEYMQLRVLESMGLEGEDAPDWF